MNKKSNMQNHKSEWAVTGTAHGSIIEATTEGEARRIFHAHYHGETINHIRRRDQPLSAQSALADACARGGQHRHTHR